MAVDLSARICTNCSHASLCPHKDEFMAFYKNRDKVMVKCGDGFNNEVDTSETVTVRIEHRYMDGPGLEKLYKELNLTSPGWYPCMNSYNNCPFMKHPFDTPIYGPYPNPIGYIEPLCKGARDINGNRLQYIAPVVPPRTNEYHVSPYPPYPTNWNCTSCARNDICKDQFDYAKLGGTVYSTFGISYVDAKIGSDIQVSSIETPDTILSYYERLETTPETFHVTSETDVFIIYYSYVGQQETVPTYKTMEELKVEGKIHKVDFFYSGKSFIYPSHDGKSILIPMHVEVAAIMTGPEGRVVNGRAIAPYTVIPVKQDGTGCFVYDYDALETGSLYQNSNESKPLDVSNTDYQTCMEMVEGDTLYLNYLFNNTKYQIEPKLMKTFNYGMGDIQMNVSVKSMSNGMMSESLAVTVPSGDFVVQTVLANSMRLMDPVNYPIIDYLDHWKPDEIRWGTQETSVNLKNQIVEVQQPIAPRMWSKDIVTDTMPSYTTDFPPTDEEINRPFFSLLGYTSKAEERMAFNPEIKVLSAEEMDYVVLITNDHLTIQDNEGVALGTYKTESGAMLSRAAKAVSNGEKVIKLRKVIRSTDDVVKDQSFIDTVESPDFIGGFAMWKLDSDLIEEKVLASLKELDGNIQTTEVDPGDFTVKAADMIENWEDRGISNPYMKETYPATQLKWDMTYMPNLAKRLYATLQNMKMPDNFDWSLFAIPANVKDMLLWCTWPEDESALEHDPHCTIKLQSDESEDEETETPTMELSDCKVTPESEFDDRLIAQFLLVIQPKKLAGMTPAYQNYKMYQIHVTQEKQDVGITFIFDGKYYSPIGQVANIENLKSYEITGLYPEDAGKVTMKIDKNVITLEGPRAEFYNLVGPYDLKYIQDITVHSIYDNKCQEETKVFQAPYRGTTYYEFNVPTGDSIKSITIAGEKLYWVDETKHHFESITLEDGTQAYAMEENGVLKVYLANLGRDYTIEATYHTGNDGSIEGCTRCKGYVDTSPITWSEWVPVCHDFEDM